MDSLLGVTAQPKKKYSPLWSSAIDHKFILGVNYGIVKGGHMESLGSDGESLDLLFDGESFIELGLPWIDSTSNHGTGCTSASAARARPALGSDIEAALRSAKQFVWEAMYEAYPVGQAHGPLNPMWCLCVDD
jgi:hydroxymethylpyrimidine/phosphomethylpyrimidine kinase